MQSVQFSSLFTVSQEGNVMKSLRHISWICCCTLVVTLTLLEVSRHICRPRLKGILTYMLPKVKGYTDIWHPNLYRYRDRCVVWVIYTRNPLYWQGLKKILPPKGLNSQHNKYIILFIFYMLF